MLDKLKSLREKLLSVSRKFTDKLSPSMKKAFCVALVFAWLIVLVPVSLLKLLPLVGGLVLLAWCLGAVLVGLVAHDTWKSASSDASR